jgi:hypothetical protein
VFVVEHRGFTFQIGLLKVVWVFLSRRLFCFFCEFGRSELQFCDLLIENGGARACGSAVVLVASGVHRKLRFMVEMAFQVLDLLRQLGNKHLSLILEGRSDDVFEVLNFVWRKQRLSERANCSFQML